MHRHAVCCINVLFIFSAGVGRTGTFIALDVMLERIPQTHDVNVLECVLNMRSKRTWMVQTKASYLHNVSVMHQQRRSN